MIYPMHEYKATMEHIDHREEVLAILRRASRQLEEGGWVKNKSSDGEGRHCAFGAMRLGVAAPTVHYLEAAVAVLSAAIRDQPISRHLLVNTSVVTNYNDDPTVTYEDVQLMFKKAITALENWRIWN